MADEFVHLHVHSQYSFLDGALKTKQLATRVQELGMRAVALTDHGNMFGAIQLHLACKEAGIGAILGCEVNVARAIEGRASASSPVDHLVLLAASEEGYRNLVRIVSEGHRVPASDLAPSVTYESIAGGSRGIVALTGCLGGVVAQQVLENGADAGVAALDRWREAFEPGALYVELQDHGLVEQPVVNRILVEAAAKLGLPLVATNDVHYATKDDAEAQIYLTCAATARMFADVKAGHHGSSEMFLKSPSEMARRFRELPRSLANTLAIAERCTGWKLTLGKPMLPDFEVPEGYDAPGYLRHVAREGLARRFAEFTSVGKRVDEDAYRKRLEIEIDVIVGMGFPGYFLIVWDFIRFAKERAIPVGPGRGSGAGSIAAYALRITDLDPIPYNLLFERFLNPERVSMPDFDIDFCMDRREEVIEYVTKKYGRDSVGQIATFHELKARSVIKDVARAMGMAATDAQQIANLIPPSPKTQGQMMTIPEALEAEPKLAARVKDDANVAELVHIAQKLEGLTRHAGKHAAGVVISKGPLWDHVPCFLTDGQLVTQYHKDDVEKAGLVKFDFLGLKTLTVMAIASRLIDGRPDRGGRPKFELGALALDDAGTFKLLQSGETTGVFQLESSGMQQLFKDYRPEEFEDIIALGALYRPGPLQSGMVKSFVEVKHGRQPAQKFHPLIDEVVAPTRGAIVYQEQVMQIAQRLAGYTLGGADMLRRVMGKKKADEMAKLRQSFVDGAVNNGVDADRAGEIFSLVEQFAGYGFNKSHSAAYGLITYQTAYLKAHYPVEFLCALMTADRAKIDKVVRIIAEGRAWGATILPPDINHSETDFTVVYASPAGDYKPQRGSKVRDAYQPQIRFGLGAVRGIGDSVLAAIFDARSEGGPFADLFDFASRVDAGKVSKTSLEALVNCGAFDTMLASSGISRARAHAAIDRALERSREATRDRKRGQATMFGLFGGGEAAAEPASKLADYPEVPPWDLRETLVREKQALGFYVSGHPLARYGRDLSRFELVPTTTLADLSPWTKVRVAGMVEEYRQRVFKGGRMAFFELEDEVGRIDVKVSDRRVDVVAELLKRGEPVVIEGKVSFPTLPEDAGEEADAGPRKPTLLLDTAELLADVIQAATRQIAIRVTADRTRPEHLRALADVLRSAPGTCPVQVIVALPDGAEAVVAPKVRVAASDAMLAGLERLFGATVVELR